MWAVGIEQRLGHELALQLDGFFKVSKLGISGGQGGFSDGKLIRFCEYVFRNLLGSLAVAHAGVWTGGKDFGHFVGGQAPGRDIFMFGPIGLSKLIGLIEVFESVLVVLLPGKHFRKKRIIYSIIGHVKDELADLLFREIVIPQSRQS